MLDLPEVQRDTILALLANEEVKFIESYDTGNYVLPARLEEVARGIIAQYIEFNKSIPEAVQWVIDLLDSESDEF